jgi:2,3-bisphosphoglycerate-dependent phosphoglycerate mutase
VPRLVLARHGESLWNAENRFTGWHDVGLSRSGIEEARAAARRLEAAGIRPARAYTSYLRRAIHTLFLLLDGVDRLWIPVVKSWRLNERHYGALEGLDKDATRRRYGAEQVQIWRRSYDVPPPPMPRTDPHHPVHDPRYAAVDPAQLPDGESLADTLRRVLPFWETTLAPALRAAPEEDVLVCAHGNSLRALVKHLEGLGDEAIVRVEIPTGSLIVYRLDERLGTVGKEMLETASSPTAGGTARASNPP